MKILSKTTKISTLILFFIFFSYKCFAAETIAFKSTDGISITADLYIIHPKTAPFIILFHQARWSRGEYLETAPKLNQMGYNCMAVDQRSGMEVNSVVNQTNLRAQEAKKSTNHLDALQDIEAAIDYAKGNYANGKLIVWGSSYSASLVLKLAGEKLGKIDAILSFSPAENFSRFGKPDDFITSTANKITVPVFITSAKNEKSNWWTIYEAISSDKKYYYLPETDGNHGSRALWQEFPDHKGYWEAVIKFLDEI